MGLAKEMEQHLKTLGIAQGNGNYSTLRKITEEFKENLMPIEMHMHTEYSNFNNSARLPYDCNTTIPEMFRRLEAKRIELGAPMIGAYVQDHNGFKGYLAAIDYRKDHMDKYSNVFPLPGEEVSDVDGGHVLTYGINKPIERGLTVDTINDEVHSMAGKTAGAHPFALTNGIRETTLKCDMIETHNMNNNDYYSNIKAAKFAEEHNMEQIVGSDAHLPKTIGRCLYGIEPTEDPDTALSRLGKGKTLQTDTIKIAEALEHVGYMVRNSKQNLLDYLGDEHPGWKLFASLAIWSFTQWPTSPVYKSLAEKAYKSSRRLSYHINEEGKEAELLKNRNVKRILEITDPKLEGFLSFIRVIK